MPNYLVKDQLSSLALLNHRRAGDKFCLIVQDCQTQIKLKLQPNHWTKKYTLGKCWAMKIELQTQAGMHII